METNNKEEIREVILIGAGGHGLSLAEFSPYEIKGYIAREANENFPGEWFGDDETAHELIAEGHAFHMAYVYSGWPVMTTRRKLIEKYEDMEARFVSIISPDAIVTPNSSFGDGCAIMAGSIVNRASLGRHVVVNSGAIVEHDCRVGDNTFIGPGAVIGGFTSIGENCFIGLGARIANGVTIGDNITVAMGAIVTKSLSKPGIYHGFPLKYSKIPI